MNDVNTGIVEWLHSQQNWIQLSAEKILSKELINEEIISEITEYLKTDAGQETDSTREFIDFLDDVNDTSKLHLESLGQVEGIDNLAPRKPIDFGQGNLTIIYGNNGSGKSGYTRILKKMCGMTNTPSLITNVFEEAPSNQSCCIKYTINGEQKEITWPSKQGVIEELKSIDVFDNDSGKVYLDGESEASYIPEAVSLFEELVSTLGKVKLHLEKESNLLTSKLPVIPKEYIGTKIAEAFQKLKVDIPEEKITSYFSWLEDDQQKYNSIEERLKTEDPLSLSKKRRGEKQQTDSMVQELTEALNKISDEACKNIFLLQNDASQKRNTAIEGARATTDTSKLEGIGSSTWVALWSAANEYSQSDAYPEMEFPNTDNGARCVLCHQTLEESAKKRLSAFQSYVLSKLESEAERAETEYQTAIAGLPVIKTNESIETILQASGLDKNKWLVPLIEIWKEVDQKKAQLAVKHSSEIKGQKFPEKTIGSLQVLSNDLEKNATQLENDAKEFDRELAKGELKNLKAKKWAADYVNEILAEIKRLSSVKKYNEWINKTNTRTISIKAGEISKIVITDAYIERFNKELKALGATHLSVELVKTRVSQGKVKHQVQLQGQVKKETKTQDVLSEGEHRIVTLAAFLADVTNKNINAPFIFDDPISSLDQTFEEQTIDRLIKLSKDRQVLIFTHRLSFLGLTADRSNPHQIHIKREAWGTGEPGEIPLFGKKPINALKNLKNERLQKAKKVLNENGSDDYYPLAKSICSDIRILVERVVEYEFLADVIQRHRRSVNTKGKIEKLAKITLDDCNLINDIMTEYSSYEHSQPIEAPVNIPDPQTIEISIDKLLAWHDEFMSRTVA